MIPRRWSWLLPVAKSVARRFPPAPAGVDRFVLLSKQRSGSTWLMDLLQSHPEIATVGEVLRGDGYGRARTGDRADDVLFWKSYLASKSPRGRLEKLRLYFHYLDRVVFQARQGASHIGFKLMYNQAACEFGALVYLAARRVPIIHLIRRNHLDAILSEETTRLRGFMHAETGMVVKPTSVELDPFTAIQRLEQREREVKVAERFLSRRNLPYRAVTYEDLTTQPEQIHKLLHFLGVDPDVQLVSRMQKLNTTDHRQLLSNYDEIRDLLEPTRFAHLLRPNPNPSMDDEVRSSGSDTRSVSSRTD